MDWGGSATGTHGGSVNGTRRWTGLVLQEHMVVMLME